MKPADIFGILEREVAPVALSDELCAKYGAYDNSGIILDCANEVTGALFCLDLTERAVTAARGAGYNLIVTHHPAIYGGIKSVSVQPDSPTAALAKCALHGISVISMHLNFDAAPRGIDYYLAEGLGCDTVLAFFNPLSENCGYGRVGLGRVLRFEELRAQVEKNFRSPNFRYYPVSGPIKRIASFCGAGCDDESVEFAIRQGADVFVSAEIKHHHLVRLRSFGMGVIDMTHYGCEIYGFGRIYGEIKEKLGTPSELFVQRELI